METSIQTIDEKNIIETKERKKFRRQKKAKEALTGYMFAAPWLLGFFVLTAYPIVYSLVLSFSNFRFDSVTFSMTVKNYINILTIDPEFKDGLIDTLVYVAISVPVNMIVTVFVANLLSKKGTGTKIYRTIFYLPTLVSVVATVMLWRWIFNPEFGAINSFLAVFGIKGPGWLTDSNWAKVSLTIMGLWSIGGTIIIVVAALQDVPSTLYEAATIDGAGALRKFFKITLPLISPVLYFNLLMGIINGFQIFVPSYIMTGGEYRTNFIGLMIYNKAFNYNAAGYASAMAWILMIIIMVFTVILMKISAKKVFYGD